MDVLPYEDLVSTVQKLINDKALLIEALGAFSDIPGDGRNVRCALMNHYTRLDLRYDSHERPRRWSIKDRAWPHWQESWRVVMPWDDSRPGYVSTGRNGEATHDQLVELINLIQSMEPTIAGGEFGLVYEGKFIAFFSPSSFEAQGATFHALANLTIDGITGEPDCMKRLAAFWQLRREGMLVDLWHDEIADRWPRQISCAGNGLRWLEYEPRRRGKAHELFVLNTPYIEYSLAPHVPVVTDKTQRVEI